MCDEDILCIKLNKASALALLARPGAQIRNQYLDKPVKYWEIMACSEETKSELFGWHNTRHVWSSKGTPYHPKTSSEVWKWEHHDVGLFFQHVALARFI